MTRILIVDDEKITRVVTTLQLQEAGYETIACSSGEEAMDRLNCQGKVDLILTDVRMPYMNGCELFSALQGDTRFYEIPFIFMSGDVSGHDVHGLLSPGRVSFLAKPIRMKPLLQLISTMLQRKTVNVSI